MADISTMTAQERAVYGRPSETMEYFVGHHAHSSNSNVLTHIQHNRFRQTYRTMYKACETGQRPAGMSLRQFLSMIEDFCHHLTAHHTIG